MALKIDFDEFGFLDVASKASPILKQPPISPIESESSSGISSLDSDDLKKQLLSSPPTISSSHDQFDEEQHSNDGSSILNEKEDENDDIEENGRDNPIEAGLMPKVISPVKVIYQNRNILNLVDNIWSSRQFIQYTVLPDNNLSCFFQNRAQYWRLGSSSDSERHDSLEKCSCCDFCYPSIYHQQLSQNEIYTAKNNTITDSLLTFLKTKHVDFNNSMPNNNDNNNINSKNINNNSNTDNIIGNNKQRTYNINAPYATYQIIQQQQQQYQNNGYHNSSMNGFNQQTNSFNNNGSSGGFTNNKNSVIAALNMMNQSRNVPSAFQQNVNNNSRYNNSTMNNNNGLYKQF